MSTEFCIQFNTKFQSMVNCTNDCDALMFGVKQFFRLYMMIQHLKSNLKGAYVMMAATIFCYALNVFYMCFYTDINQYLRYLLIIAIIVVIWVLIYFSIIAGTIEQQTNQMSNFVYRVVVIDKRFKMEKYRSEVCV